MLHHQQRLIKHKLCCLLKVISSPAIIAYPYKDGGRSTLIFEVLATAARVKKGKDVSSIGKLTILPGTCRECTSRGGGGGGGTMGPCMSMSRKAKKKSAHDRERYNNGHKLILIDASKDNPVFIGGVLTSPSTTSTDVTQDVEGLPKKA